MRRTKQLKTAGLALAYGMSVTKFAQLVGVSKELAERLYQDVRDEKKKERS